MVLSVCNGRFGVLFEEPDCPDHAIAAALAADHLCQLFDHPEQWLRPDVYVTFPDHDIVHLRSCGLGWMTDDHSVIFGKEVG